MRKLFRRTIWVLVLCSATLLISTAETTSALPKECWKNNPNFPLVHYNPKYPTKVWLDLSSVNLHEINADYMTYGLIILSTSLLPAHYDELESTTTLQYMVFEDGRVYMNYENHGWKFLDESDKSMIVYVKAGRMGAEQVSKLLNHETEE